MSVARISQILQDLEARKKSNELGRKRALAQRGFNGRLKSLVMTISVVMMGGDIWATHEFRSVIASWFFLIVVMVLFGFWNDLYYKNNLVEREKNLRKLENMIVEYRRVLENAKKVEASQDHQIIPGF